MTRDLGRKARILWGWDGSTAGGWARRIIANERGSLPVAYQLYLPHDWASDRARRKRAGVPTEIKFRTKGAIALEQIQQALVAGLPPGVVLADAAYGTEADWRDQLSEWGLTYAVGVRENT